MFSKVNLFSYLALFLAVMAFDAWLTTVEIRSDGPARWAPVRFTPIRFDPGGFAPLQLAGAWRVEVDDPRFGGVSALAADGDGLLALTDSGSLIRLPLPARGQRAFVRDLPAGPGIRQLKVNRDSEALARDPAGRGWWVAFEQWHQLWLYDPGFGRAHASIDLGVGRWPDNGGLEAIVASPGGMLLFPQSGGEWLKLSGRHARSYALDGTDGDFADAARLPDGRLLLVTRQFGLAGITSHLVLAEEKGGAMVLRRLAKIGLGARDNVEAIAAAPRAEGGTRLWLMTDNDFRPRKLTLLVALDLP